jgi:hypothetical protein
VNIENFFKRGGIKEEETEFAARKNDLISINPHISSPFARMLRGSRKLRSSRLVRAKPDPEIGPSAYTLYASDDALANLNTILIVTLGLGMLLGPMWWLEGVSSSKQRLGIITGFLALFMVVMSLATAHRPFEVIAASAAYAAVLVVFMQIDDRR